jgi:hypothetical protein
MSAEKKAPKVPKPRRLSITVVAALAAPETVADGESRAASCTDAALAVRMPSNGRRPAADRSLCCLDVRA